MKAICILTCTHETYFTRRLSEVVGNVQFVNCWQTGEIPSADVYLIRGCGPHRDDKDLMLAEKLEAPVFNPPGVIRNFRDKSFQSRLLTRWGIPVLPWLDLRHSRLEDVMGFLGNGKVFVKPNRGQGGWGTEVIVQDQLLNWWEKRSAASDLDYILQPYKQNMQEFRLFFTRSGVRLTLERLPQKGPAANFHSGGVARIAQLPGKYQEEAERLILLSEAVYGAIDFLVDPLTEEMFVLELNTAPGIEQLEKLTDFNVMKALCHEFLSD